jgi:hypothetical protein
MYDPDHMHHEDEPAVDRRMLWCVVGGLAAFWTSVGTAAYLWLTA